VSREARRTAAVVVVVAAAAFVALAWWQVPWTPVPGGAPSPVPPESILTREQIERAEHFSRWARVWSWSSLAVSLAVACWLGFSRAGTRLVRSLQGPWPVRVILAVAACAVIGRCATLPLASALHQLRLDVGLTNQAWGAWLTNLLVGELVVVVASSCALLVLVGCARRWHRRWPVVAGGLVGALVLLGSFVYPVMVEPLTQDFRPLSDGSLRGEIVDLSERQGVTVDEVLVTDASRRTTSLNAYVSGFGATHRVVLYDTLVEEAPREEVLAVVSHELAHAGHDDVLVGSVLGALAAALGVGALGWVLSRGSRRVKVADPAVVPRVLALVAVAGLAVSPVQSGISRLVETRADVEALSTTDDADAFLALQRRLAVRSLADPTPPTWSQLWFGTHPTLAERAGLAEEFND